MRRLDQGADRTDKRTLAARNAIGFRQGRVEHGDRQAFIAAFRKSDHVLLLACFTACFGTQAALGTFGKIPPDAGRCVVRRDMFGVVARPRRDFLPVFLPLVFGDKALQPACAVDFTAHAVVRVPRQQPFPIAAAERPERLRIRFDHVALFRQRGAGRLRFFLAFNLDQPSMPGETISVRIDPTRVAPIEPD